MKVLFVNNTLIDYLNGVEAAREEISRYDDPMISPITWMEVMVGTSDAEQDTVRAFLSRFNQVDIDAEVADIATTAGAVTRCACRMRLSGPAHRKRTRC